jgi:hypothetical protein
MATKRTNKKPITIVGKLTKITLAPTQTKKKK